MAFSPESRSSGMSAGTSPFTRMGCASDAMPPASRMMRHALGKLRLATVHVALRRFVQILVEGLRGCR